jgi:hypothetical protein
VNVPGQLFQVMLPVGGSRLGSGAVRVVQFMDRVRATTHQDGCQLRQADRHRVAFLIPGYVDHGFDGPLPVADAVPQRAAV